MKKILFFLSLCVFCQEAFSQGFRAENGVAIVLSGAIQLVNNGDISINTGSTLTCASGSTILLNGASQNINFGVGTTLGNLTIAGTGAKSLQNAVSLSNTLTFSGTNANLILGDNHLTLLGSSGVTGAGNASGFVLTDGLGELRANFAGVGSKSFPVGEGTGTIEYSPLEVNINSGTFGSGNFIGVRVVNGQAADTDPSNYLLRYWNISNNNISNAEVSLTATYLSADIVGSGLKPAFYQGGTSSYGSTDIAGGTFSINVSALSANGILTATALALSTVRFVATIGNDTNDGLNAGNPKQTISGALSSLPTGGTINIAAGTYNETAVVTQDVIFNPSGIVNLQNLSMNGVGKSLTLANPLLVNQVIALQNGTVISNGNLILTSSASGTALIDDFTAGYTGSIIGDIQVQRYVPNANVGYRYFGSPVTGATASQFGFNVLAYNESILLRDLNKGWLDIPANTVLNPFEGYNIFQTTAGSRTYTLTGTVNTGSYNRTLTRQVANGVVNNSAGYNSLGNPYPSPISWTALLALNPGQTLGSVHLFKTTELYKGQWAAINSSGIGTNGASNFIPSMQGFLVRKATAGSSIFTINNSVRTNVYANNSNFLRPAKRPLFRLELSNSKSADEVVVYAERDATQGIDPGLDTEKLEGEADKPSLAIITEEQDLSILALDKLPSGLVIPLSVRANGTFNLQINEKNLLEEEIYLIDQQMATVHALREAYQFKGTGTTRNRFVVYLGNKTGAEQFISDEPVRIWSNAQSIFVYFKEIKETNAAGIDILDGQGRVVWRNNQVQKTQNELNPGLAKGLYLVRVNTPKGVILKKIIIQ